MRQDGGKKEANVVWGSDFKVRYGARATEEG